MNPLTKPNIPQIKAAVCHAFGTPLTIKTITLAAPAHSKVEVTLKACTICHSNITYINGSQGNTLPAVYSHKTAGHVTALGAGIHEIALGNPMVVTLIQSYGTYSSCASSQPITYKSNMANRPLTMANSSPLHQTIHTGGFAKQVIINQSQVVKLSDTISIKTASLLACRIITSIGTIVNATQLRAEQNIIMIKTNGINLNTIQGAQIASARQIVAMDITPEKLAITQEFGATDTVLATSNKPQHAAKKAIKHRADTVFVTVSTIPTYNQAPQYLTNSGKVIMVNMPHSGAMSSYEPIMLTTTNQGIVGSKMNNVMITHNIP